MGMQVISATALSSASPQGLKDDDYALIGKAARETGYTEAVAATCRRMGGGVRGFAELAIEFHKAGDRIADAADWHDKRAVLAALQTTLTRCTACHAIYRQQIVPE